jgi:hypothetical protein
MSDLSVVGAEFAIEVDETFDHVTRQVLGTDATAGGDGRAHLIEVGGAGVATGQVLFEPASLSTRKGAVEIVRHQFDGVATYQR